MEKIIMDDVIELRKPDKDEEVKKITLKELYKILKKTLARDVFYIESYSPVQKAKYIESLLKGSIHKPTAFMNIEKALKHVTDTEDSLYKILEIAKENGSKYIVIHEYQKMETIIDFINGEVPFFTNGKCICFKDLSKEQQKYVFDKVTVDVLYINAIKTFDRFFELKNNLIM